jgi:flagellar basal-body rod protein FlgF
MFSSQTMASVGAARQQDRITHMVSNNLSNAQTPGFKKNIPLFQTFLSGADERLSGRPIGTSITVFQQGTVHPTGNPLDIAIEGQGFFKVKTEYGVRYTRAGNFTLDKGQRLVDGNGNPVQGRNGEITVRGKNVVIDTDGSVKVDGNVTGQIALVTFADLQQLYKEGHTLYAADGEMEEIPAGSSQIAQGSLEQSNVNAVEEMINLLDSYRSYESCLKLIQSNDSLDSKAVNELGRV